MVPVVDLSRRARRLAPAFEEAVRRVLRSGHLLLGPEVEALEAEVAEWTGYRHVVAVSSGSAALQLALAAMGVGAGDEVIVPALTAVPTASAVRAVGAVPVPVDVERETATLDPSLVPGSMSARTTAVVTVHLYGRPASRPAHAVPVLDDAAQAHGALRPSPGGVVAYSFYPTKNLGGVGDGGAVATDDAELAATLRRLRVHGMTGEYVHVDVSQNFRMSELEAAWLRLALPELAAGNARRRAIAAHYRRAAPGLRWQQDHPDHVYHLCVVRVPDRSAFRRMLGDAGVATAVHYPLALTQQPAYRVFARTPCPEAEAWAAECVTLPCFPELTDAEVEQVAGALERTTVGAPG